MSQQQQILRQRQKLNEIKAQEQEKLKSRLNSIYATDILNIARHFGNQPKAITARVIDIDDKGISIEWEWKDVDSEKTKSEDMQFAFREGASSSSALQEISDLASEATKALGINEKPQLTRDKEALDARTLVDFEFAAPSVATMVTVLLALALTGYMAYVEDVHPSLKFIRKFVSMAVAYYIFVFAAGIHLLEALSVCAICQLVKTFQPRQMSTESQIKWTIGSALFGVFCMHDFVSRIMRQFALADSMKKPAMPQRTAPGN
ncbi:hypothetical protein LPJ66_004912 [Kickxella alabastrina]|uniref:Uncharacterized protein n=1 Tax=Kickxella alabastrina TaxID=61397 RepID=A0ACC1IKD0_9FUNG|nr:hypothetical protein LPJ66_004912 [Kickxella alabastrina]